ncbi:MULTISPECIES: hydrophobic protein [unclassified Streptomyces]|uniref:hydrophobic protein n=1 Tax=unclassified Streptomyces TaxID=2593676 RepID=UPI00202485D5|nr:MULTISPECIES: hydrophobic protein [unclassified Streptomyces]WSC23849.1 hydrophobic protein [Streptomyces sp. NBC_01766]
MGPLLIVFLILVVALGLSFLIHALWWIVIVIFVLWILGLVIRPARRRNRTDEQRENERWYHW